MLANFEANTAVAIWTTIPATEKYTKYESDHCILQYMEGYEN